MVATLLKPPPPKIAAAAARQGASRTSFAHERNWNMAVAPESQILLQQTQIKLSHKKYNLRTRGSASPLSKHWASRRIETDDVVVGEEQEARSNTEEPLQHRIPHTMKNLRTTCQENFNNKSIIKILFCFLALPLVPILPRFEGFSGIFCEMLS